MTGTAHWIVSFAIGAVALSGCCGEPDVANGAGQTGTRWEYKIVGAAGAEQRKVEQVLIALGADGWELVDIITSPSPYFWQRDSVGSAHNEIYPPVPKPPERESGQGSDGESLYTTVDELLYGISPAGETPVSPTGARQSLLPSWGSEMTWVFKRPAK